MKSIWSKQSHNERILRANKFHGVEARSAGVAVLRLEAVTTQLPLNVDACAVDESQPWKCCLMVRMRAL